MNTQPEIVSFLLQNGYASIKFLKDGRIAALMPLIYTTAIVTFTPAHVEQCYEDRWCYHSAEAAQKALEAWDGTGEPQGWHRHPASGRRRPNGDPLAEFINA